MSIKTNHTTEKITPDSGVLTLGEDGAIKLPVGTVETRPPGIKGLVRFSEVIDDPEYYDGIAWQVVSNKDYVDTTAQNLQSQINNIVSNIDPAALDSLAEIVAAFQDADIDLATAITTLTNSIATETQNRIDGDNNLQTNLDAEIARATAAETAIDADLSAEVTRATNAEAAITNDMTAETAAREAADTLLAANIAAEELRATAAEEANASAIATETTRATNAEETLASNLTTEVNRATAAEGANATAISTETARAIAAEGANADAIAAETTRALAAELVLTQDLAAEITRATTAEQANATAITNEITRAMTAESDEAAAREAADTAEQTARIAGDANLQSQIDNILSNNDPSALDSLTEIIAAYEAADSDIQTAISNLTSASAQAVADEAAAREASDNQIISDLAAEVARATAAESTLTTDLNTEITDRAAADVVLQANIDAEAILRAAGDAALQTNLDTEQARAEAAENILTTNLAAETQARIDADADLQSQIDNIISNIDTTALDSLTEIVAAFQDADIDLATAITTLQNSLDNLFAGSTTDDLTEGSNNLYYTDARARDALNATDGITYDNITGEFTLTDTGVVSGTYGSASEVPVLEIDNNGRIVSATTTAVAGVASISYDVVTGQLTVGTSAGTDFTATITLDPFTTDDLVEGLNNLYYTDARVGTYLTDNSYATETYVDNTASNLQTTITNLTLDDLSDVTITTPSDGQVLVYDVVTGEFRTQTQAMNIVTKTFVADGSTYDFDIVESVSSIHNIVVTVNGIQQEPIYSFVLTDGHIVTFDELPEANDKIQVKILRTSAQTDRPRPRITNISYSTVSSYTTITITTTDTTYGTGVKIGDKKITRIDYISANQLQVMIETSQMSNSFWNTPQDLTLIDTSGNEYTFTNLINYSTTNKPYFTNSNEYIGTFSGGDSISFTIPVNNAVTITINPAYAGESAIGWLSISGSSIVGTAPNNSSPSRYEISVIASNGSVDITKNYWLLVV